MTDQSPMTQNKVYDEFDLNISYPFPLSDGKMARIYMPLSVTKKDVARLIEFIKSIQVKEVVDDTK